MADAELRGERSSEFPADAYGLQLTAQAALVVGAAAFADSVEQAAAKAITGQLLAEQAAAVLVCSDGAARLATAYQQAS